MDRLDLDWLPDEPVEPRRAASRIFLLSLSSLRVPSLSHFKGLSTPERLRCTRNLLRDHITCRTFTMPSSQASPDAILETQLSQMRSQIPSQRRVRPKRLPFPAPVALPQRPINSTFVAQVGDPNEALQTRNQQRMLSALKHQGISDWRYAFYK